MKNFKQERETISSVCKVHPGCHIRNGFAKASSEASAGPIVEAVEMGEWRASRYISEVESTTL